jgi:hypothetical protein
MQFVHIDPFMNAAKANANAAADPKRPMEERVLLASIAQTWATIASVQATFNAGVLASVK